MCNGVAMLAAACWRDPGSSTQPRRPSSRAPAGSIGVKFPSACDFPDPFHAGITLASHSASYEQPLRRRLSGSSKRLNVSVRARDRQARHAGFAGFSARPPESPHSTVASGRYLPRNRVHDRASRLPHERPGFAVHAEKGGEGTEGRDSEGPEGRRGGRVGETPMEVTDLMTRTCTCAATGYTDARRSASDSS